MVHYRFILAAFFMSPALLSDCEANSQNIKTEAESVLDPKHAEAHALLMKNEKKRFARQEVQLREAAERRREEDARRQAEDERKRALERDRLDAELKRKLVKLQERMLDQEGARNRLAYYYYPMPPRPTYGELGLGAQLPGERHGLNMGLMFQGKRRSIGVEYKG
jgi:membrane protein involved in colicin uptake